MKTLFVVLSHESPCQVPQTLNGDLLTDHSRLEHLDTTPFDSMPAIAVSGSLLLENIGLRPHFSRADVEITSTACNSESTAADGAFETTKAS